MNLNQKIILFDGYCNLCDWFVSFLIKRDEQKIFTFISLQSKKGQSYLRQYNLPMENFETVILIQHNEVYTKSTAALLIMKNIEGPLRYFYLCIHIPKFFRDFIYTIIAKNRYTFFGQKNSCDISK